MVHLRQQDVFDVARLELDGLGAEARVAGEVLRLIGLLVDEQLHAVLIIVHQAEDRCRPRRAVQQVPKLLLRRERQAGRTDLVAQILRMKRLVRRHT